MHQPNPRTLTSDRWLSLPTAVRRDPMTTAIPGRIDSPGREYRATYDQGLLRMPSMQMTVSPPALGSVLASSHAQGRDPLAVRSSFVARFLLGVHSAHGMQSPCFSQSATPSYSKFSPTSGYTGGRMRLSPAWRKSLARPR